MKTLKLIIIFLAFSTIAYAQEKGEPEPEFNPDTTFIFKSPRPLIESKKGEDAHPNAIGFDILFSDSGFGLGGFFQTTFQKDFSAFASLYISGYRNTDEFEVYDPTLNQYIVPNKINRLFIFPLMFGVQKTFLSEILYKNLRPFLSAGFGPVFIMSTPYPKEFFSAFGDAKFYTRVGGFIGAGANFGVSNTTIMGVNFRYYYVPFGGNGLESIKDNPIKNFGGVVLSLSIGKRL